FPYDIIGNFFAYEFARGEGRGMRMLAGAAPAAALRKSDRAADGVEREQALNANGLADKTKRPGDRGAAAPEPDLSNVSARKNLNETAFFFPHLTTDKDGTVRMEFTMPEALTEWKFLGFAHDVDMRAGLLTDKVVTSKELMIQPNAPRFVREGDKIEFTVKVSNQSAGRQSGKVRLSLADAVSLKSVDELLDNSSGDQTFDIPAGESKSFSWKLSVPDGLGFLTYKAVGSSGRLSDREEGYLPLPSPR